jgi:hypothetical protein
MKAGSIRSPSELLRRLIRSVRQSQEMVAALKLPPPSMPPPEIIFLHYFQDQQGLGIKF